MKSSGKFRPVDLLLSIAWGFTASLVLDIALSGLAPEVLAGGHTEGAGGLDNLMMGLAIVFFGFGIVFSLIAGWILAKRRQDKSSDGWWPPPPL
jgi:hypothetical protein